MVSINNALTQRYFRSETAVNNERIRHIQLNYWYIVHPLSKLRHYVSGVYFTCDVLSSIPIFPIIHFCEVFFHTRLFIGIGVLYAFCELKLIRVVSVIQFISTIVIYFRIKAKETVFLVMCVILMLFTVHTSALLELLIPKLIKGYFARNEGSHMKWFIKYGFHKRSLGVLYSAAMFKSSACILAVRLTMFSEDTEAEDYVLAIVIYIVGKILICTTYVKLKTDVNLYLCRSLVMNVSIFSDLTAEQVSKVVELLIPQIFLPKDTIFQYGSYGDSMYFISSGTVAIYTHSGREVTLS
nr:unnamed protein product [Callosobruchus chinensis]